MTMPNDSSYRILKHFFLRFFFLCILLTLPVICIRVDILYLHNELSEQSLTEYLQELFLFGDILIFTYAAYSSFYVRRFCVLLVGFFACLLVRELDGLFDLISHGFWIYPALIIAVSSIVYALQQKQQTIDAFCLFVQSHNFISMCLGIGILFVFSRLFGMGSLWNGLQHNPERLVKNVAEEGTESLGYIIIFSLVLLIYLTLTLKKQAII